MSESISAIGAADSIGDGAAVHPYYDRERQFHHQHPWQQQVAAELHEKAEQRRKAEERRKAEQRREAARSGATAAQQVARGEHHPASDRRSGIDTQL
jgi:hypothetical protein